MRILPHGPRTYAIGLFWQLVDSPHVRPVAASLKMDAFVLIPPPRMPRRHRQGRAPGDFSERYQTGFGLSRELIRARSPLSLAALLVMHDRALTQFVSYPIAGNLYWHVAIQNGVILPEGDHICDADACEQLVFQQQETFGNLVHRYATAGDLEQLMSELVPGSHDRAARLAVLKSRSGLALRAAVALFAIVLLSAGYIFYSTSIPAQHAIARKLAAARAHMRALAWRRQREARLMARAARARPWLAYPRPAPFSAACEANLRHVPYVLSGWQLSIYTCLRTGNRTQAEIQYRWRPLASRSGFPAGYDLFTRQLGVPLTTIRVPVQTGRRGRELLTPADAWRIDSLAHTFGWVIHFRSYAPKQRFYPVGRRRMAYPWRVWDFTITGESWPFTLARSLQRFPGVRIQRLGATFGTHGNPHWHLTGDIYVR